MFMFSKRKITSHLARALAGDVRGGLQEEGAATAAAAATAPAAAPPPPPPPRRPRWRSSRPSRPPSSAASLPRCVGRSPANVTSVSINQGIGTVQNTGNRRVFPSDSTTYTLTATGPGGTTTATATVSV